MLTSQTILHRANTKLNKQKKYENLPNGALKDCVINSHKDISTRPEIVKMPPAFRNFIILKNKKYMQY